MLHPRSRAGALYGTALLLALLAPPAMAQAETLLLKRASELRQAPGDYAASIAPLAAQAPVTRLPERQGPWMRIRTESGQVGWVHMFDLGTAPAPSALGGMASGALRGLGNLFGRSSSQGATTTATSTVGIRGLGAEDIANAQPNLAALQAAEAQRADATQARRFAADAQLAAREVAALPVPAAPPAQASGSKAGTP